MPTRSADTFEQDAKSYADCCIENIRDMVGALEHSRECDGTVECEDCAGTGRANTAVNDGEEDCKTCDGTGEMTCPEGKDSDDPESWHDEERAQRRIEEDALSVEVRGDWHTPGDEEGNEPTDYQILLTTGGPAARIIGELRGGQPHTARFEYQDWFKPWTEVIRDSADYEVMREYAACFYFEG